MKKRWLTLGTALMVSAMMMTGCGSTDNAADATTDTTQETTEEATEEATEEDVTEETDATEEADADFSGMISPISREDGSGTRGAFIELFGIETKDEEGNKIETQQRWLRLPTAHP